MGHARVALVNLGCRVNRAELDAMARELASHGCELVDEDGAEAVVVNTCAVTAEAQAKTRHAVRHAASRPGVRLVVATGCAATLFADELLETDPCVMVEPDKERVASRVLELADRAAEPSPLSSPRAVSGAAPVTPTGRMRPGLKIQDGCDRRCTYCIVWKARGPARSLDAADVIERVRRLEADGAREVVLTGIDLGRYRCGSVTLASLLSRILAQTGIGRARLSSVEPAGVTPELLEVMAGSDGRVAPFLHVPLQSGCDATLLRMGRPYSVREYAQMASQAIDAVPGLALSTDVIVGFPGETDEEFERSLATCRELGLSGMHVFRYSRRPGTPAAQMDGQVDAHTSAERSRIMRQLSHTLASEHARGLVGTRQLVLCERGCLGTTGSGVRVRTDPGLVGRLAWLVPHGLDASGMLNARS